MAKKEEKIKDPSKLDEVLGTIKATNEEDVKLHFITRILRNGVGKRDKTLDKYLFKVYQIDVDDEIRQLTIEFLVNHLEPVQSVANNHDGEKDNHLSCNSCSHGVFLKSAAKIASNIM